ncbi:MAG TPA: DUF4382 domain-containing protein [bacterium]|nr:DUF4382 domain-containing protein [bacterium]
MKRAISRGAVSTLATLMTVGAVSFLGCSDGSLPGGAGSGSAATGTVRVHLTDAPYPFDLIESAEITIDRITAHYEDEDAETVAVLGDELQTLDLMDLRNGVTATLVETEVPVGTIDELRLRVVDAVVTLIDGREFPLKVPSGQTSGLKAKADPAIVVVGDLTTDLLLDVDVSRSFLAIPASPRKVDDIRGFHFKPVVRVENLSTTGSVSGHVQSDGGTGADLTDDVALAGATVTASLDGTDYTTATDAEGFYRILGLPEGAYLVTASADAHQPDGLSVSVFPGNDSGNVDFLLMETSPAVAP